MTDLIASGRPPAPLAIIVLAAGKGTRMRSALPKVLHPIAGAPMLHHCLRTALALRPERVAVVVGHEAEAVGEAAQKVVPDAAVCLQAEQRGTGHAVQMAAPALAGFDGDVMVLYGDTPFIAVETLEKMRGQGDVTALGFEAADPGRYGRLKIGTDGALEAIVEAKDASPEELAIRTCNSGVMTARAETLFRLLGQVTDQNAQGEFYLTDVPGLARAEGLSTRAVLCDEAETLGINDRVQLAAAEATFQTRARRDAMLGGATLTAPETVFFAWDTQIGQDVEIGPNVVLGPGVRICDGARIHAFCHLEQCEIGPGAAVGPFARLRGGTRLAEDARIGNFVEAKNAEIGPGTKAMHLTYLGDAAIGPGANIGAGTITCNYDGVDKHRTEIGARAFIGTNTALIAPVAVGDGAYVATGTVVTKDVPPGALAIARTPQTNREDAAIRLRATLAARKAAKTEG